jgi:apolipoprotein N-acyltransferase
MKTYLKIILVLISAILTALSFYDLGFLAWFSLMPYFLTLYYCRGAGERLYLSFFFGIVFFAGITFWFTSYTFGLWIPIIILLSLFPLVFGLAFHFIYKIKIPYIQLMLMLAAWCAIEFFRCRTFMAFPWGVMAYSQYNYIPIIQITNITGVYGLSAVIVLFNLCSSLTIKNTLRTGKFNYRYISFALALVLIVFSYGIFSINTFDIEEIGQDEKKLDIALVQTNISFDDKFEKDTGVLIPGPYSDEYYFKPGTDLVVFAESILWGSIEREKNGTFSKWARETARKENLHFLMGHILWDEYENYYNAVILYSPEFEILGRYNKIHPLPFAEYMPYPDVIGFLKFLNIASCNITPDRNFDLIYYPGKGSIGTNICFESTLSLISRTFRKIGADILFVLTDDAGFRQSSASWHHVIFSVFRAVENKSYMVHSSNMGPSAVIDPQGRIILAADLGHKGVFYETVYFIPQESFYAKAGNILLYTYFGLSAFFLIFYLFIRRPKKPGYSLESEK